MSEKLELKICPQLVNKYRIAHKSQPRSTAPAANAAEWKKQILQKRRDYEAAIREMGMGHLLEPEAQNDHT